MHIRHVRSDLDLSRVMSYNFNLNPHIILAEPRYPNTCPNRLVVWHPFLEIPHHRLQGLVVDRDVVRVHPKYLLPPFSSCVLQVQVHVGESLVDLRIDLSMDHKGLGVPAAYSRCYQHDLFIRKASPPGLCTYLGLRIRCDRQCGRLGCNRNLALLSGPSRRS